MGSCCDDRCQPRRRGRSCSPGCTSPVLWHSVCADSCPWFPSRKYPAVLLPLHTRGQPSPHVVENAPEATSTAPAGTDREPSGASSGSGHLHPAGHRLRRGHSTWPGACPSIRGAFDAVGDSIPVPGRAGRPQPHRNVPARAGCPQPQRPSAGRPWHPGPLLRQLRRHRLEPRPPGPTHVPEATRQGKVRALPGTPESGRRAPPALTGRGGSPLSQQPGAFGEDRQVHPVTGTDPLLRTAQVGLDG